MYIVYNYCFQGRREFLCEQSEAWMEREAPRPILITRMILTLITLTLTTIIIVTLLVLQHEYRYT